VFFNNVIHTRTKGNKITKKARPFSISSESNITRSTRARQVDIVSIKFRSTAFISTPYYSTGMVDEEIAKVRGATSRRLEQPHQRKSQSISFPITYDDIYIRKKKCVNMCNITTVKASIFGPHGNFKPLSHKGLVSLKRVLLKI
jgi:hypothetical protein